MATLYTIGHSTRTLDELIATLRAHNIRTLVDIRAFPASRRLPQFNRELLETNLPAAGIRYVWMKALGGYRKKILEDSPHIALRNESFRNYADYAMTPAFRGGLDALCLLASGKRCAIMCAETVWWQCHRKLISDAMVVRGIEVVHLVQPGRRMKHELDPAARVVDGDRLVYDVGVLPLPGA